MQNRIIDQEKTIEQLSDLRRQVSELKKANSGYKRREEIYRRAEEKHLRLKANIPGMVYEFALHADGHMSFPYVSDASQDLFGIASEDLMRDANLIIRLQHPDDREKFQRSVEQSAQTLQSFREEVRHIVNGEVRFYDCISQPARIPGGPIVWDGIMLETTAQKRIENTLKNTENKYRRLFDTMQDAFVRVDMEGRIIEFNQSYKDLLGYTEEELRRLTYIDLTPAQWHVVEQEIVDQQILKRDYSEVYEKEYRRKDGTVFPVELRTFLIRDDEDQPIGMWAIVRDISERKNAENAIHQLAKFPSENPNPVMRISHEGILSYANDASLPLLEFLKFHEGEPVDRDWQNIVSEVLKTGVRQDIEVDYDHLTFLLTFAAVSESQHVNVYGLDITDRKKTKRDLLRTQFAIDHAKEAIFWLDKSGRTIYVNDEACRSLGNTREELLSMTIFDFDPVFPRENWPEHWEKSRQLGSFTIETQHRTKDGQMFPVEVAIDFMYYEGQEYHCSYIRDITERKQAEQILRETSELLANIISTSPLAIVTLDLDRRIKRWNPAFEKIFGWSEAESIGKVLPVIAPNSSEEFDRIWEQILAGNSFAGIELHGLKKDDTAIDIGLSIAALKDQGGTIVKTMAIFTDITEPKELQRKLRESEELYRSIISASPDGIALIDPDGNLTMVSDTTPKMFGYSKPSEMIGRSFMEFVAPEDREKVVHDMGARFRDEIDGTIDLTMFRSDGTRWNCEGNATLIRDNDGKPITIVLLAHDITLHKQMEAALQDSEEKYRSLIENLNDTVFSIDLKGVVTYVSPMIEAIIQYNPTEIVGHPFREFVHPEDFAKLDTRFREILQGAMKPFEYRLIRKDGQVRTVYSSSRPKIRNEQLIGITGIMSDITERKKTEDEIRKLSLAVQQNPSPVIITDIEGNIEYVNNKLLQVTGYSREELIGQNPRILKSEETLPEVYKDLWSTILAGKTWLGELYNKRKNGEKICEDVMISPIFNESGNITHFLGLIEDITEKKQLESQLRQSQKMEAVGHLAGGVAHDFNNLLTIINGYSDLMIANLSRNNTNFERITQIRQAGRRAEALTRQLLAFSRKQIMKPLVLNPNQLLQEMEKMLRRLIGEDVELTTIYDPYLYNVKADPGQMEQVILNLVVNSRDAIQGGGKLEIVTTNIFMTPEDIRHHAGMETGDYARISVSDNGTGMDSETLLHIFEPFFTTKSKNKGTGLGLSTVYGIIKQSGGFIYVDSKPGEGTTFDIYLKAIKREKRNVIGDELDFNSDFVGSETIMLVEDEESVRDFVAVVLEQYGYTVLEASHPEEALGYLKSYNGRIDLLLTDIVMPGMNGKELADQIQQILPDLQVIFMSGYTDNSVLNSGGVLGPNISFLQKPFSPADLVRMIRKLLGGN